MQPATRLEPCEEHIATHHVERRMAEDLLEAEHVAAVQEVAPSERVAERGRRAARGSARPPPESGNRLLGAALAQRTLPARQERVGCRGSRSGPEIPDERPPGSCSHQRDPFLRALADNVQRPQNQAQSRRAKGVRRTSWGGVRRTSHLRASLEMPSVTLKTTSSGGLNPVRPHGSWCWLARKDSNLRSPDPESGALPLGHSPVTGRDDTPPRRRVRMPRIGARTSLRRSSEGFWYAPPT